MLALVLNVAAMSSSSTPATATATASLWSLKSDDQEVKPRPPPPPPPPPPLYMPIFHVPFNVGHGGCCADVNAIAEYKGVKHLFKQNGGVVDNRTKGLGFAHYISDDFVRWKYLSTVVTPGGADGSLSFLPEPTILWDCGSVAACKPAADGGGSAMELVVDEVTEGDLLRSRSRSEGCKSGDAAIIGVARPADPSDPKLEHWLKDAHNPIVVENKGRPASCYAGPSNLWPSADGTGTNLVMIFNSSTGLFRSTDKTLHNWSVQNGDFYPIRGGGGGLFYKLPKAQPAAAAASAGYTHMLQSDFPGQPDGTAFYALGTYNEQAGSFDGATGPLAPCALDFSPTYVYNQLGYRADGSMVNVGWIRNLGTSVVRAVSFDPALGGQLLAYPVPELATLRTSTLGAVTKPTALPTTLVASGAVAADIELLFALDASAGFGVTVTVLGGSAAVELSVAAGGANATIVLNGCHGTFPLPAGLKEMALRLLVDGSVVEAFAAGGRGVCSVGVNAAAGPAAVVVAAAAGSAPVTLLNATAYNMSAI